MGSTKNIQIICDLIAIQRQKYIDEFNSCVAEKTARTKTAEASYIGEKLSL